ncbi:reverse transcriptase domain-containing protein [Tanacetum coccineum]
MKYEYLHNDGYVFIDYSWERALSIYGDVYPEWCLEFFSTMYFDKGVDRTKLMTEKCVWFRLCGVEKVKLNHRAGSKERCQKRDMWMMSALEESRGINLAWVIVEHLCKHAPGLKENSLILSNKRAKHNLDSTYLWHCRLAHISKKRIEKLQHNRLLKTTDEESFDQCVSCLSGKMTRKPFPHRTKMATDLLGLIHTDVCGPLRHVSRQGASYFINFTDGYSRYGYVDRLLHHEVKGRVDGLVEGVEGLENQRAELVVELAIKMVKEVTKGDVRGVNMANGQNGCSYKDFMACNPKDYDGKGGAIVYTLWIKKTESVQDMSGCGANQKVKYLTGSFIVRSFVQTMRCRSWKLSFGVMRCSKLAMLRTLIISMSLLVAATESTTIQSDVLKVEMLTDEAIRNGSLKKNTEKRGNVKELSRNENVMDDNKRSRIGRAFATITNPIRKEYRVQHPSVQTAIITITLRCLVVSIRTVIALDCRVGPRMVTHVNARNLTTARGACFECGGTDHYKATYPGLTQAPRPRGNRQNQPMAIEGGQGCGNNSNQARGGAFMMGAEEAR